MLFLDCRIRTGILYHKVSDNLLIALFINLYISWVTIDIEFLPVNRSTEI